VSERPDRGAPVQRVPPPLLRRVLRLDADDRHGPRSLGLYVTAYVDDTATMNNTRWKMMDRLIAKAAASPLRYALDNNETYTDPKTGTRVYGLADNGGVHQVPRLPCWDSTAMPDTTQSRLH
jgi:hypothetical protein